MATTNDIYSQYKNHLLSVLENPFVIAKIQESLLQNRDKNVFDDTFEDIRKYIELARNQGVLALSQHKIENAIIQEFVEMMVSSVSNYAHFQKEKGSFIDFEFLEFPTYVMKPKILYNDLPLVDFTKTILLYEAIIMAVTGYSIELVERRLNGVIRV